MSRQTETKEVDWLHFDDAYIPPVPTPEPEPREKKHRNGFHALKLANPKLYRGYSNHIRLCLDAKDYGYKSDYLKKPIHANEKEDTLNFWLDKRNKPYHKAQASHHKRLKSLSLKKIEEHGKAITTLYYTSNPYSKWALLMLDIDDKEGQAGIDDVKAVQSYLATLFPNHFNQISTGGKGWRGYIVVRYPRMQVAEFRDLVKKLEDSLQSVIHARFKSTFEIKGNPGLLNQFGGYRTCGQLAKIPRLSTEADISEYMEKSRQTYSPTDLQAVIDRLTAATTPLACLSSLEDIDMTTPPVVISISSREGKPAGGQKRKPKKSKAAGESRNEMRAATWSDPCTRMDRTGWNLSLSLKRAATEDEILSEYERQGLNTGEDIDGNRRKLAKDSAEWCLQHYDSSKQDGFDKIANIELVTTYVSPEIRFNVKRQIRKSYTDEQLAVLLFTIERSSLSRHRQPHLQFTVPNNSILAMMKRLNIEFDGTPAPQRSRLAAMKTALVESGLAEIVNPHWYRGKGKCFGLGKNHPKFAEYESLKRQLKAKDDEPEQAGIIRLSGR